MMAGDENRQRGYLRQGWLVIVLAFAYGGALAGVQTSLAPRIAENRRRETYRVIPLLVEGAKQERTKELLVKKDDGKLERVYQTHDAQGIHNGWIILTSGQGFADKIDVLIGLDTNLSTITGLYVLAQKETPGLGDYIRDVSFLERFRYKPTDTPLVAVKSDPALPNEIQALSGATVSSWSVCDIVNEGIDRLRAPILREMKPRAADSTDL